MGILKSFLRGRATPLLASLTVAVTLASLAQAAPKKRSSNEQYSATEEEDGQAPETRPLLMPTSDSGGDETQFAGVAAASVVVPAPAPAPAPQIPPTYRPAPTYAQAAAPAYNEDTETAALSDAAPLPPPPSQMPAAPFDAVPPSQKSAIRERIHLVDRMIARYGRAYDYRTHTLRELRAIMAELDAQAKQNSRR